VSLAELNIGEEYYTSDGNLVDSFYRPCLSMARRYDRAVGFFRSSIFLLVGPDIIEFVKRGGKIRLACSPVLSEIDIQAIADGYAKKDEVATKAICRDVDQLLACESIAKNTEALATLIAIGAIEVKLIFFPEASGEFHSKLGVFHDDQGNAISFKGSVNESWTGWHERGNNETLDVFCGWKAGRDARQVERNDKYFNALWNGEKKDLEVLDFPQVAKDRLRKAARSSLDYIEPDDLKDYFAVGHDVANQGPVESHKEKRKPYLHQQIAITNWEKQHCRGILEHATGSGKTFTALTALKKHLDPDGVAIVLVPDKLLQKQWSSEICEEIDDIILLKVGGDHNRWKKDRRLFDLTSPLHGLGKRVVLATMQTARTDTFLSSLNQGEHLMIIADEVHEIGSRENSKSLSIESGPRLGLSATPKRYGDPEGTAKILDYFGAVVQPPYTLVDAINDERLVPYEYYPRAINLSAEEADLWAEETDKISTEFARSRRTSDGRAIVSKFLQILIIQRSRIAKKARAKIRLSVEIIKKNYRTEESWLIYCEDQFQLREVMDALRQEGFSPLEYHTGMVGDSTATLEHFKNFGGILCSIRCLDQGVDIPQISHALILASSQNPRQFIQRRGRVLRTCANKHKAVIYDAVVVPISIEREPEQLSLLKSEFQRSLQFAKSALNSSAAIELTNLAIELGIDPDEFEIIDSDGIEDTQDDPENE